VLWIFGLRSLTKPGAGVGFQPRLGSNAVEVKTPAGKVEFVILDTVAAPKSEVGSTLYAAEHDAFDQRW
jgi:hypothetical protein